MCWLAKPFVVGILGIAPVLFGFPTPVMAQRAVERWHSTWGPWSPTASSPAMARKTVEQAWDDEYQELAHQIERIQPGNNSIARGWTDGCPAAPTAAGTFDVVVVGGGSRCTSLLGTKRTEDPALRRRARTAAHFSPQKYADNVARYLEQYRAAGDEAAFSRQHGHTGEHFVPDDPRNVAGRAQSGRQRQDPRVGPVSRLGGIGDQLRWTRRSRFSS